MKFRAYTIDDARDLLARLEQARNGNVFLNQKVAELLGYECAVARVDHREARFHVWFAPGGEQISEAPAFSTSLATATTLPPDGATWAVGCIAPDRFFAWVSPDAVQRFEADACTPTLALCRAAIDSRALR